MTGVFLPRRHTAPRRQSRLCLELDWAVRSLRATLYCNVWNSFFTQAIKTASMSSHRFQILLRLPSEHYDSKQKCDNVSNKFMLEIHSVVCVGFVTGPEDLLSFYMIFFPLMSGNGRFSRCFMSDWWAVHAGFRFYVALLPALVQFQPSFFIFFCPWGVILPDHVRQGSQPHMCKFWGAKLSFIFVAPEATEDGWKD